MESEAAYNAGELKILIGGKILDVKAAEWDLGGGQIDDVVRITVQTIQPVEVDGKPCRVLAYEIWQDPEGNGPGHVALIDAK